MFDKKLFGYDKDQVDRTIERMCEKIKCQQKDIDFLRNEKVKLKEKLQSTDEEYEK